MVGFEGNFCTEPRISVLTYWASKLTCKEGRRHLVSLPFNRVSMFGMWETKPKKKEKKKKKREDFFASNGDYWKTKVVQQLTRKARPTLDDPIQAMYKQWIGEGSNLWTSSQNTHVIPLSYSLYNVLNLHKYLYIGRLG